MPGDKFPQGRNQPEQRRGKDVAFAHIDDAVAAALAKTDDRAFPGLQRVQRRAAARAWRRKMGGQQFANGDILRFGSECDALCHELAERCLVRLLQLATPARAEMAAWGIDMMGTAQDGAVFHDSITRDCARYVAAAGSHTIALGSDAEDTLFAHRKLSSAGLTFSARPPAVKPGPARRAAS